MAAVETEVKKALSEERDSKGRFKKGVPNIAQSKGGRKPSRDKLSNDFITALSNDFEKHGVASIQTVRQEKPVEYLKLVAMLIPKEHKVEVSHEVKELTDVQVLARIRDLEAAIVAETGQALQDLLPATLEGDYTVEES